MARLSSTSKKRPWPDTSTPVNRSAGQPAESVVFFIGERAVRFAVPDYARPDVVVALDNPELARTGFEATLHSRPGSDETLRVVAVRGDIGTELQVQLRSVTGSGLVAT